MLCPGQKRTCISGKNVYRDNFTDFNKENLMQECAERTPITRRQ